MTAEPEAEPAPVLKATDLDLRYDPVEDRLLLTARGADAGRLDLWLTRRLARSLLNGLVDVMARSNDEARRASAMQRNDVLLFEHLAALERRHDARKEGAVAPQSICAPVNRPPLFPLLTRVDLTIVEGGLLLRLMGAEAGGVAEFRMPRDAGHQLLHALTAKCREAQWAFSEFDWIDRRANIVVPSGMQPC